jgi:hypothetical protein
MFEKLLCIYPKPEVQIFSRTARLCFALVNEIINMVHGHANLDVLDNCDLQLAPCLGCLFGQKEGIFLGEKKSFSVESFYFFFCFSEIFQIFNAKTWKKKP